MRPEIDDYINANRARYTREAITDQLLAAGHSREAVEAAWERSRSDAPSPDRGWRPGWITFAVLVVVGAIGAWLVWAGEPYGGAVIAPVAYVVVVSIAFGLAKGISILIDTGRTQVAGIILALLAAAGVLWSFASALSVVALAVAALAGIPAILLFARSSNGQFSGFLAAAIPLVVWLAVTGTCYAPVYGRLVP